MSFRHYVIVTTILLNTFQYGLCELITLGLAGAGAAMMASAGGWYWGAIKDNTYCRFTECCNAQHVPYDIDNLKSSLDQKMFGQPLVTELVNILQAHKEAVNDNDSGNKKALVISLHGWPGVGKNFAAGMIADAIYKKGMNSKYVRLYMGKKHFDCTNLDQKKEELINTLNEMVKKCPKSLIIFDEIHDMCPSVLDAIKPMFDHHHAVDGVDYRNSVFVFISNIGGQEIADKLLELYEAGANRNEVEFHDFEPIIRRTAYVQGGFKKAAAIANHLIDHYIPFLPLESKHVEMCAAAGFRDNGVFHPSREMMEEALSVITYGPNEDKPIFANNGCKRFTKQIPYIIQKYKQKSQNIGGN